MMRIHKRVSNKKGFTLTELLVSVLILGLLGSAISIGISAGSKVYNQSIEFSESGALSTLVVQMMSDEIRNGTNFKSSVVGQKKVVAFDSQNYGEAVSFQLDENGHVTLGGKIILSDSAYTNDVMVRDLVVDHLEEENRVKISFQIVDQAGNTKVTIGEAYDFHLGYLNEG